MLKSTEPVIINRPFWFEATADVSSVEVRGWPLRSMQLIVELNELSAETRGALLLQDRVKAWPGSAHLVAFPTKLLWPNFFFNYLFFFVSVFALITLRAALSERRESVQRLILAIGAGSALAISSALICALIPVSGTQGILRRAPSPQSHGQFAVQFQTAVPTDVAWTEAIPAPAASLAAAPPPAWSAIRHNNWSPSFVVFERASGWPFRAMYYNILGPSAVLAGEPIKFMINGGWRLRAPTMQHVSEWRRTPVIPYLVHWPGFLMNLGLFSTIIFVILQLFFASRVMLRRRFRRCVQCGYPEPACERCPECGLVRVPPAPTLPCSS